MNINEETEVDEEGNQIINDMLNEANKDREELKNETVVKVVETKGEEDK